MLLFYVKSAGIFFPVNFNRFFRNFILGNIVLVSIPKKEENRKSKDQSVAEVRVSHFRFIQINAV